MASNTGNRPLKLLAAPDRNHSTRTLLKSRLQKRKREVARNACENCRARKAKCSGRMPCTRCTENNVNCVFKGRAHEQLQQELTTVRQELATCRKNLLSSRRELETSQRDILACQQDRSHLRDTQQTLAITQADLLRCQQQLATFQEQLLKYQQGFTSSHLTLLELQQNLRDRDSSLDIVFELLRRPTMTPGIDLKELALTCSSRADFLQKLSSLYAQKEQKVHQSQFTCETFAHSQHDSAMHSFTMSPTVSLSYPQDTNVAYTDSPAESGKCRRPFMTTQVNPSDAQATAALPTIVPIDQDLSIYNLQEFSLLPKQLHAHH